MRWIEMNGPQKFFFAELLGAISVCGMMMVLETEADSDLGVTVFLLDAVRFFILKGIC